MPHLERFIKLILKNVDSKVSRKKTNYSSLITSAGITAVIPLLGSPLPAVPIVSGHNGAALATFLKAMNGM